MYRIPRTPENEKVYTDLIIYPIQPVKYGPKPKPVICYRQSDNYIYIPRYFGFTNYGIPSEKNETLSNISLQFNGEIREYQRTIVSKTMEAFHDPGSRGGVLALSTGSGKCLKIDTPIIMYDGTVKMVQNIQIGDKLMGDDSTPRKVISLARGTEEMFEIRDPNGESYTVNKSHILSLKFKNKVVDIPLTKYLRYPNPAYKGYRVPLEFKESNVPEDPYTTGKTLNALDCIPMIYKCNAREIRLRFLAGVIDEYCSPTKSGYVVPFGIFKKPVMDDLIFLVRSLGISYNDGLIYGTVLVDIPCKKINYIEYQENTLHYDISVVNVGVSEYYGFEIDGNRRFVLGDFSVTHNTVIALKVISELKVKTLIVIHKEILMDQWKERIQQFLPNARVGTIQKSVIDTIDKDIILGMIQSISMKEYENSVFKDINLLIVDECHVINSRSFSKTLFKVHSKYKLGLSATPNRVDGLDKVVSYHIGPIIYTLNTTILDPIIHVYNAPSIDIVVDTNYMGNANLPKLITDLSVSEERNEFIIKYLNLYSLEDRKIIVFSDRVDHCKNLKAMFDSLQNGKSSGVFIGKMDTASREESMKKDIIFCSYSMAKEGFDLKELDTLMFATPRSDIVQAIGRILRQVNKNVPVVIDIVDSLGILTGQFMKRKRYYTEKNYIVERTQLKKASTDETQIKNLKLFSKFRIKKENDIK